MRKYDWEALPVLQDESIRLRPMTWDDTERIVSWRNNPRVRENFIFQDLFTPELHANWIRKKVMTGEVIQYIIERTDTGLPIGSIYYRDIDYVNESAELGIFIGEDLARGHGYGTKALTLFVNFGLQEIGLHRIQLRVLADNVQARRSYIRAGFQEEGVFHDMIKRDEQYISVVFMSIIEQKSSGGEK